MDGPFVKSNSHCKSMQKRGQPIRMTEHSIVAHLVQSEGKLKDRERSQPVRISQLLGPSKRPKSVQKSNVSARKKVEPERLANFVSKKENTWFSEKKQDTHMHRERQSPHRTARRVLNFNEVPNVVPSSRKDQIKPIKSNVPHSTGSESIQKTSRKRSLLLPPNSIKLMHLKKTNGAANSSSKLLQQSKTSIQCNKNRRTEKDCTIIQAKDDISKIEHTQSPKICITSILKDPVISGTNPECTSSETITVNRQALLLLETNLKHLISETEENLAKLKSALEHVSKVFGNTSCTKKCEENTKMNVCFTEENEEFPQANLSHSEESNKITVDNDVQIHVTEELPHEITSNAEDLPISDSEQCCEDNKENIECSNMNELCNIKQNDSFVALENKLNITHPRRLSGERSYGVNTSVTKQFKTRGEKSLREYMALKSSMSFLETPDAKRFRSLCLRDNTEDRGSLNKTYISSKVLANLHNLYSESPDI